jgi:hypothetical protein
VRAGRLVQGVGTLVRPTPPCSIVTAERPNRPGFPAMGSLGADRPSRSSATDRVDSEG